MADLATVGALPRCAVLAAAFTRLRRSRSSGRRRAGGFGDTGRTWARGASGRGRTTSCGGVSGVAGLEALAVQTAFLVALEASEFFADLLLREGVELAVASRDEGIVAGSLLARVSEDKQKRIEQTSCVRACAPWLSCGTA